MACTYIKPQHWGPQQVDSGSSLVSQPRETVSFRFTEKPCLKRNRQPLASICKYTFNPKPHHTYTLNSVGVCNTTLLQIFESA